MKKTRSTVMKDTNIITHIVFGVLLSLLSTLLMSILLTAMIEKEIISFEAIPAFTICVHAISVFVGTMLSVSIEKGRIAVVAGIVSACYFVILLCFNMLIFSAGFEGIGMGVVSVLAGGLLGTIIKSKFNGKKKHRIKLHSR